MTSILNRYIFRETVVTWLVVTVVLMLILITDQFARVLDDAADAELPRDAVITVMGLASLQYMTILFPVGLFLSIMLAMARLYRDSEMAAIAACSVGPTSLYRPVGVFALLLAALVAWVALDLGPAAGRQIVEIGEQARQRGDLSVLEPGRFVSFGDGDGVLYAEAVTDDGRLQNVFVQNREGPRVNLITAREAFQRPMPENNLIVLVFQDGKRYEGVPGSAEFRVLSFREHGIPISIPDAKSDLTDMEIMPSSLLWDMGQPDSIAELQWRLSVPLTLIVLAVIAVPLSKTSPRQGRYGRVVTGIMLYVIYANLLGAARVWVEQSKVPVWVGLWWVHLLFLAGGLALLMSHYGYGARFRRQWARVRS